MPSDETVSLAREEIYLVLGWAAAADFEAKLDDDDAPLVERLAAAVGEDPDDYYVVWRSRRDE